MALRKQVQNFGTPYEGELYGFSEAVRVGDSVYVSGQTAFTETGIEGVGDVAVQMRVAYGAIAEILGRYGATMENVVDETLFVTDMAAASAAAPTVRKEVYAGRFEVASTLIGVKELGAPELLIEIKCTARV